MTILGFSELIGRDSYLLLFMPGPFGCLGTGGRFIVGTVNELQQVLHPPVVLHPSISLYYWLLLLTFRLLLLTFCQTQAQLLPHLCIVSTGRSSWRLGMKRNDTIDEETLNKFLH